MKTVSTLLACVALSAVLVAVESSVVRGRVVDPDGLPLPGATVTLLADDGRVVSTATTDGSGAYDCVAQAGRYTIRAELSGFQTIERRDVVVDDALVVIDLTLPLASFATAVTVTSEGPKPLIDDATPDAPVVVTREVVDSAMLPNSQYDDVLPLMPNVVRGPDGQISVGGARAPQGALIVNGINQTDPTTGEALLMLPLESVDSLKVYAGGYPAEFGRAAGGVTAVVTRSGADRFHASMNSFFPRLLIANGGIHGVEYWEPNSGVSGPILKGRAYFEQGLSYRYDRNRFTTLAGPQQNKYEALISWTQLDVQALPSEHLVASVAVDPQRTDRANITAFTTAGSAPQLDQTGWSAGLADHVTLGRRATLELRGSTIDTRNETTPNGSGSYQIAHDATLGSYFDSIDLHGRRVEGGVAASAMLGRHTVTLGASAGRATIDGTDQARRVELLRSDGTIARTIAFTSAERSFDTGTTEIAAYAQDSWAAAPWLTMDVGARFDRSVAAASPVAEPRAAFTIRPGSSTTVSGSVGLYADKIVLGALAFPSLPTRFVRSYDAGTLVMRPMAYRNAFGDPLLLPEAFRWDLEADRDFGNGFTGRVKYSERHGRHELIVDPVTTTATRGELLLDSTGRSDARSLETTVGYRAAGSGQQVYASYVRSATRGDLNSFDAISGIFREPFVQPDQVGPLPADVPNRLLAWGVLHAPARITVAPFVEIRDGFPYSAIDDTWAFVGPRDGQRLPWFGSLDLYVNKIVGLPGRLPDARVGLKLYNVASVHTARDVQRDIARPDFGTAYNPIPRDFSFVFELLWGH